MPSKQVTDKEKSARAVASAADTHAAQAASALEPLLSPYLKSGEKLPRHRTAMRPHLAASHRQSPGDGRGRQKARNRAGRRQSSA